MRRSVSRITRQARSTSTTRTVDPRRSSGVGAIGLGGVKGTRLVPGSGRHLHRINEFAPDSGTRHLAQYIGGNGESCPEQAQETPAVRTGRGLGAERVQTQKTCERAATAAGNAGT